jgi:hypothetical protein
MGPCRGMELAAAVQDVRGLLYLLLDLVVPTPMKVRALLRATHGEWQEPSQNFHNGVSTAEETVEIHRYENQRLYNNQACPRPEARSGSGVLLGTGLPAG